MKPVLALPPEMAAFIQGGVSITLASRDERHVPSIAKGVGCQVNEARDAVRVLVFAHVAEALLRDVALSRCIAVAFSQPSTHRTLQIKGRDAELMPTQPADVACARRHMVMFAEELRPLGWDAEFVHGVFWHDPEHLVVLRFTPEGAFHQTPGSGAGAAAELQAGAA
jgi:hypothetical protein